VNVDVRPTSPGRPTMAAPIAALRQQPGVVLASISGTGFAGVALVSLFALHPSAAAATRFIFVGRASRAGTQASATSSMRMNPMTRASNRRHHVELAPPMRGHGCRDGG